MGNIPLPIFPNALSTVRNCKLQTTTTLHHAATVFACACVDFDFVTDCAEQRHG